MRHGHHKGEHRRHGGAQTFRRGRALAFLESLDIKRRTLLQQLEQPEFQEINAIIRGELKAIDAVRNEFVAMFELYELERQGCEPGGGSNEGGESERISDSMNLTGLSSTDS